MEILQQKTTTNPMCTSRSRKICFYSTWEYTFKISWFITMISLYSSLRGYKVRSESYNEFKLHIKTHKSDLDCSEMQIIGEKYLKKIKWKSTSISRNIVPLFCECDRPTIHWISIILKILTTLPVTTATSERSFTRLKRLKTYIFINKKNNWIVRVKWISTLLNIHREILITTK